MTCADKLTNALAYFRDDAELEEKREIFEQAIKGTQLYDLLIDMTSDDIINAPSHHEIIPILQSSLLSGSNITGEELISNEQLSKLQENIDASDAINSIDNVIKNAYNMDDPLFELLAPLGITKDTRDDAVSKANSMQRDALKKEKEKYESDEEIIDPLTEEPISEEAREKRLEEINTYLAGLENNNDLLYAGVGQKFSEISPEIAAMVVNVALVVTIYTSADLRKDAQVYQRLKNVSKKAEEAHLDGVSCADYIVGAIGQKFVEAIEYMHSDNFDVDEHMNEYFKFAAIDKLSDTEKYRFLIIHAAIANIAPYIRDISGAAVVSKIERNLWNVGATLSEMEKQKLDEIKDACVIDAEKTNDTGDKETEENIKEDSNGDDEDTVDENGDSYYNKINDQLPDMLKYDDGFETIHYILLIVLLVVLAVVGYFVYTKYFK